MLPVVTLPDAELAAIEYLRPRLVAVPEWSAARVGTLVSASRPFVQLRRVGGAIELPGYDAPRLDVIAYAADDATRMRLAHTCWGLLRAAAGDRAGSVAVISYAATLLGPRQMPDPADATKRVAMLTVDLLVRPLS